MDVKIAGSENYLCYVYHSKYSCSPYTSLKDRVALVVHAISPICIHSTVVYVQFKLVWAS